MAAVWVFFFNADDDDDDDDDAEEGNGQEKVSSHLDFFVFCTLNMFPSF